MPKSKRSKVVHLSKTEKKGKELSHKLFASVRESIDKYQYCFVFSVDNMRNSYLKDVRTQFSDSRLFFGKTKVMAKALGMTAEEEHLPNISSLTPFMTGSIGLFCTSQAPETVLDFFGTYSETDFARAGTEATRTFEIPPGVVYSRGGEIDQEDDVPLAHSLEPTLRKWGMPTKLVKGKIVLDSDAPYEVCRDGQVLNSHQTALLKMFGVATADFRVNIKAYYGAATQTVTTVQSEMEE